MRRVERIRFLGTLLSLAPRVAFTRWASTHTKGLWIAKDAMKYGPVVTAAGVRPFVLMVWGSDVLVWPNRSFAVRAIVQSVLRSAGLIVAGGEDLRSMCIELGAEPERVVVVPWYDYKEVQRSRIGPQERCSLRDKLGIQETDVAVVSSRWHAPVYSVETLISAAPAAIRRFPRLRFIIIGSGPLTPKLKRTCTDLGVSERFTFLGRMERPDVLRYTQAADIYVSTSLSDVSSVSLLDSMALGVPVVVTNIPGNRQWVHDGVEGLLFQRRDSATLTNLLVQLAESMPMRDKLSAAARSVVLARTDWNANSEVLRSRLQRLAKAVGSNDHSSPENASR
jgi:glycosyltransferase involved in cell wall biosynthesis